MVGEDHGKDFWFTASYTEWFCKKIRH